MPNLRIEYRFIKVVKDSIAYRLHILRELYMTKKRISLVSSIAIMAVVFSLCGCGGGGGSTQLIETPIKQAKLSGTVNIPTEVGVERVVGRYVSAAISEEPLVGAMVTVSRLKSDGSTEDIPNISALTDDNGDFTLADVPEEDNLIITATKLAKISGRNKKVTVTAIVSIDVVDSQAGEKQGFIVNISSTLVTQAFKDVLHAANENRAANDQLAASDLPRQVAEKLLIAVDSVLTSLNAGRVLSKPAAKPVDQTIILTGTQNQISSELTNIENSPGGAAITSTKNNAATKGSLTAKVIYKGPKGEQEERGNKVVGATVVATIDGASINAVTDNKGDAFFDGLEVGKNVDISVAVTGYEIVKTSHNIESAAQVSHVVIFVGPSSTNQAPEAKAGPDQTVLSNNTVTLDGSKSFDPDADQITYAWTQTQGTTVTLSGATTAGPSFIPTVAGTYTFSLIVSDASLSSTADTVTITVVASLCSVNTDCSDGNAFTTDTCLNPGTFDASCTNIDDTPPYVIEFIPADGATGVPYNQTTFSVVFSESMETLVNYNDQTILTAGGFSNTIKKISSGTLLTIDHRTALYAGTFTWDKTYVANDTLSYTLIDNLYLAAARREYLKAGFEYEITKRTIPTNLEDTAGNALDTSKNITSTGTFFTKVCETDLDCTDYNPITTDTCSGAGTSAAVCKNQ